MGIKPKVAQMNLSKAWGGMEMSTLKIARHFHGRQYDSFVITSVGSFLAQQAREARLQVIEIPTEGHFSPGASWLLRQNLLKRGIGVVMVHQLRNLWILRPAIWGLPRVRVIGFARMFLKNIKKTDFLHRHLYSRLEKMVTLSDVQRRSLLTCLPLPEERYVTIPNAVDMDRFHPKHRNADFRRREFSATRGQPVIGVIGRLDPQKGQMEFIESAAQVLPNHPGARFVIVGEETAGERGYLRRLEKRIEELKLARSFVFLGHRTDTPELIANMDVLVVPSYEEAFGNVVLEGMASAVPVIATRAGGPMEIISGEWGQLVAPKNSTELAGAISRYLDDPERAREQGQNGRRQAERRYPVHLVMNQIESLVGQAD